MIYKLTIRGVKEEDFNKDCPFPDTDENILELNLDALIDHIQNIPYILKVERDDCVFTIKTNTSIEKQNLLSSMEDFFKRKFCILRYISLERQ